jgi:pimeloyl-[acyl-carrier protein] methyl ester esterase
MRDMEQPVPGVHVEALGAGNALVLLHGFAMNGGLFAPLVPELARAHLVHVVDVPGHGRSPPLATFEMPRVVEAIDGAIGGSDLTVLGWSLGGQIALAWARAHPQRIRKLVLVATTPSFVEREGWPHAMSVQTLSRFGDELRASYRLTLQRFLALQVHGSVEGRATLAALRDGLFERGEPSREALDAALDALIRNDLRATLPHIAVPTLVIGGERDALVPLAATRELAAELPNAIHVTIDGAAHAPFLSHRRRFVDTVLSFVDG